MNPQGLVTISHDDLKPESPHDLGGWNKKQLSFAQTETQFLTNHICEDISCTLSNCLFEQDYHSQIEYNTATTLLIFGQMGYSQFHLQGQEEVATVRAGDVWLLNAEQQTLCRFTPAHLRCQMSVIRFATRRIQQALKGSDHTQFELKANVLQRLGHQESCEEWLADLAKNPMMSAADRLMAEARALEVLARWLMPSEPPHPIDDHNSKVIQQVKDLLTADLSQQPSLDGLAHKAQMSHTRLNRLFKQHLGATVFDWLRQYRLQRAKTYLMDPQRTITEVSFLCGFSSASHFAQSFKKVFACSPSEFRLQQKL